MKTFALACLVASACAMSQIESAFLEYISQHGKAYSNLAEYEMRLRNFAIKHAKIEEHNATESAYKVGHNKFSDWTDAEFKATLTYKSEGQIGEVVEQSANPLGDSPVNWITNGCISPIQDQGQCGSCWAFSSQASMEAAHCIHNGNTGLEKFSEQQLVDCVKLCYGCNGGLQSRAFNYLESHYEMSESSYPYTGTDGTCAYDSSNNDGVKCTSWANVTADSPTAMKTALNTTPLAVAIQADQFCFQHYTTGVFTNTACGVSLDHATNVVGWGTEDGMDYWLMRNSWGTSWGMEGYIKIEIVNGPGLCGIQMEPLYPMAN